MGLKEKAEKLKKKKRKTSVGNVAESTVVAEHDTENTQSPSNFGTIAALIVGAIGIILLKGRKS